MPTIEQIIAAVERDDNSGFCLSCGFEHCGGVEPDARNHPCDHCGELDVFGAEELLIIRYADILENRYWPK